MPGADPASWWALTVLSDDRPLRPEGATVSVSPSRIDGFADCNLRWLLSTCGGEGPSVGAATIGTLVHDIAAELGDVDADTMRAEVEARWGRLGLPAGWLSPAAGRGPGHGHPVGALLRRGPRGGWGRVGVELDMQVELGRAVLRGRVDRLERDPDGALRVVDLKTGPASPPPSDVGRHGQLGAYQVAVEHGAFAEHGTRSAGAALLQVGKAAGAKTTLQVQQPLERDDEPGWADELVTDTAEGMAGSRFLATVGPPASSCRAVQLSRAARGQGDLMADALHGPADRAALGNPGPTAEQQAVIEAPLRPLLVVAGAGSGKTETMASRVVWLVANGHVEPDQVLGLTFTRKAATELAERIARRLRRLRHVGLWTPDVEEDGAEVLGGTPTVSTYHSYAGRLVREHVLRLGIEPESRLLSEAAAWQFAAEVVERYDGPMDDVGFAASTVTAAVVDLAGEMAEHLLGPDDLEGFVDAFESRVLALPKGASRARTSPRGSRTP